MPFEFMFGVLPRNHLKAYLSRRDARDPHRMPYLCTKLSKNTGGVFIWWKISQSFYDVFLTYCRRDLYFYDVFLHCAFYGCQFYDLFLCVSDSVFSISTYFIMVSWCVALHGVFVEFLRCATLEIIILRCVSDMLGNRPVILRRVYDNLESR
jgi:hypothetical protein